MSTTLGKKISKRRLQLGLTQGQIALACGWIGAEEVKRNNVRVSNYELDKREPNKKALETLAKALKVKINYFYD